MKKSLIVVLVIIAAIVGIIAWGIGVYNKLVGLDEAVTAQWAQVDNAYKRRSDLMAQLVPVVKGYAAHEKSTFESVVSARAKATQLTVDPNNLTAEQLKAYQASQSEIQAALGKLLMIQENYPTLKADKNFLDLQTQIEGTENRISTERHRFNEAAKEFNSIIRKFPYMFFGFEKRAYFEATEVEMQVPDIQF